MENIQLRSKQELDDMNITIQVDVHHALELTQENAHNNMNEDTTVVPQMNEDGNSVSHGMTVREKQETIVCEIKNDDAKEKESKCVMENGNKDLTVIEKDNIVMKKKEWLNIIKMSVRLKKIQNLQGKRKGILHV